MLKTVSILLAGALAAYVLRNGWRKNALSGKPKEKEAPPGRGKKGDADVSAHDDVYMQTFDTIESLLEEGKPRAALNRVEKLLAAYPQEDNGPLLYTVSICFDGLMDGKSPEAVVKSFDKLSEKSPAFQAALDMYGLEDFCDALAASFVNIPDEVGIRTLRKAVLFIREPHPLVLETTVLYPGQAADYLNSLARRVFEDWGEEEAPLGETLKKLDARLA